MLRTVTTRPRFTDLTLATTLKTEIAVTGSADDTFIAGLIKQATGAITRHLNRDVARQGWHEGLSGFDSTILCLSLTPVVSISLLTQGSQTVDPSVYSISNPEAGFLQNPSGWLTTEILGFPAFFATELAKLPMPADPTIYYADYIGGWLMPGDDITSAAISVAASDQSFNISGAKWPILVPGDVISTSGTGPAANRGSFTVLSATSTKIVVSDGTPLIDESAGASITMAVRNLPFDIERACIETIKGWYFGRDRDWTTKSERIGGTRAGAWQAEYSADQALPPQALSLLAPYIRYA